MIRGALVAALIVGTTLPAGGERLWLVVGASDHTAAGIALKARRLAPNAPGALIVRTGDCGEKRSIFAWVPEVVTSSEAASAALSRVRSATGNGYLKRCDARTGTLLALRITAVDPSIADVPESSVNWEEKDRITTVRPLRDGRSVVIVRSFVPVADDPLEGRRESVILADPSGNRQVLEQNCVSPGPIAAQQGEIAFECAREEAGGHLLHDVVVFDRSGKKRAEIQHCRSPKWRGEHVIECEEESVGSGGTLTLRTKRITLPGNGKTSP